MNVFVLIDALLQGLSAVASVGRVYTTNRVVGRRWNLAALSFVGLDYAVNYADAHRAIQFTGALVFGTLAVRTGLILGFRLDGAVRSRQVWRALISGGAWLACAVIVTANQYRSGGFAPQTLAVLGGVAHGAIDAAGLWYLAKHVVDPSVVALTGMGLGCLGESMGDMVRTRRCVLGMGLLMSGFAAATHNWGQLFKNVVADVGTTTISAIEFQDRPLAQLFPGTSARLSDAVRRFRSRYLAWPSQRPLKTPVG
jgi:hypothetical protein